MSLEDAVKKLLSRGDLRWRYFGYGASCCSSCGAKRDDESGRAEPCSPSCPWRQVEEALTKAAEREP